MASNYPDGTPRKAPNSRGQQLEALLLMVTRSGIPQTRSPLRRISGGSMASKASSAVQTVQTTWRSILDLPPPAIWSEPAGQPYTVGMQRNGKLKLR